MSLDIQRIHAFTEDGSHITSFGQLGEAPGDLPANPFVVRVDPAGTLVVGGMRNFLAWLAPDGEPIRTLERGDGSAMMRDIEFLPGGRIALSYAKLYGHEADPDPPMVHVLAPDGSHERSFATSTFWTADLPFTLAEAVARGRVTADGGGSTLLFVQAQPFELRRYAPDGTLLASTREGAGDFVHDIELPKIEGSRIQVFIRADSHKPLVLPDGKILVYTWRKHPEDIDLKDPKERPRIEKRLWVYDADLRSLGYVDPVGWPLAIDPQGRMWVQVADTETPTLARYWVR